MEDKSKTRVAQRRVGTSFPDDITEDTFYVLDDHLGSSNVRLNDSTGAVIDREEYYPFGDNSLRTFTKKRYRYVGKEKDLESGLYYYGARYYSAWACRFISVDQLFAKYAHLTPYNYAGNKPINHLDVDGMQSSGDGNKAVQADNEGNIKATIYLQDDPDDGVTLSVDQLEEFGDWTIDNISCVYDGQMVSINDKATITNVEVVYKIVPAGQSVNLRQNEVLWTVGYGEDSKVSGNKGYMNYGSREGNVPAHEFGHHLGLADRYVYWQDVEGAEVDSGYQSTSLYLWVTYDSQYFGNEEANLMSTGGDVVTDQQWSIIFSRKTENIPIYTFFSHFGPDGGWVGNTGGATLGLDSIGNVGSRTARQNRLSQIGKRYFNAERNIGSPEGRMLWDYTGGSDSTINRSNMMIPYNR
jgi:RHS repeat-associated protein